MKFTNIKKRYALIVRHWKAWEVVDISYVSDKLPLLEKIYEEEYERVEKEKQIEPEGAVILLDLKEGKIKKGDILPNILDFDFYYDMLIQYGHKIKYMK